MTIPAELPPPAEPNDLQEDEIFDYDPVTQREAINARAVDMNQTAQTIFDNTAQAKDKDKEYYAKRKLESAPVGGYRPKKAAKRDPRQAGPSNANYQEQPNELGEVFNSSEEEGLPKVNKPCPISYQPHASPRALKSASNPPSTGTGRGQPTEKEPQPKQWWKGLIKGRDSMAESSDSPSSDTAPDRSKAPALFVVPQKAQAIQEKPDPLAHLPDLELGAPVYMKRTRKRLGFSTDGPYSFVCYNASGTAALLQDGNGKQFPLGIDRLAFEAGQPGSQKRNSKSK
jgi:hypothetical protein